VAYGGGLENRCSRKGTVGSNPTPSASLRQGYGWQAKWNIMVCLYPEKFER
jgi:hypothetical protein